MTVQAKGWKAAANPTRRGDEGSSKATTAAMRRPTTPALIARCWRFSRNPDLGRLSRFVIDYIKALKRGGSDIPANMEWQTIAAARAKDKVE
jgi:hypothetical protein